MKRLVYLLLFLSVGLNAQVLRTYPPYQPPVATEEGEESSLLTGDLAYFKLDDASTTIVNESGTGNLTATGTAQSATSKLGYSQQFAGDDYIRYGAAPTDMLPTSDEITISAWVRMTSLPSLSNNQVIVRYTKDEDPWQSIVLFIASWDDKPYFVVRNQEGTEYSVNGSGVLSIDTWYHIMGICRGAGQTLQLYINNTDVSESAGTFTGTGFVTGVDDFHLGNDGNPGSGDFLGFIDEVMILDRVPTAGERTILSTPTAWPFN